MTIRILTPSGYRAAADLVVGDEVSAFDIATGAPITNSVERIQYVAAAEWASWWKPMVDRAELPEVPAFKFYRINGQWTLNSEQSIWYIRAPLADVNVCHVRDLQVGDTLFDDVDRSFTITSFDEVTADGWYRFDISGDHSYIVDGLTLHNASRFAVNAGNVAWTWDLTTATHWASVSNGSAGASAPGSADSVTFDASSGGNVVTPNYGGTGTFQSITCGAFTGTIDWSVNNNNVTLSSTTTGFSGTGSGIRTVKLGGGTFTLTSTSVNSTIWNFGVTTNLTYDSGTATIDLSGAPSGTNRQIVLFTGLNIATLRISGDHLECPVDINGSSIGVLITTAPATVNFITSCIVGNMTLSARFAIFIQSGVAVTLTNAPTLSNGTETAPNAILSAVGSKGTLSLAAGALTLSWFNLCHVIFSGGAAWTFNKSTDIGNSTGATINPPKYISRSRGHYLAEAA